VKLSLSGQCEIGLGGPVRNWTWGLDKARLEVTR